MQAWPEVCSFEVKVDGFSHKLPLLAGRIFQTLSDLKVLGCWFALHTVGQLHITCIRRCSNALCRLCVAAHGALRVCGCTIGHHERSCS